LKPLFIEFPPYVGGAMSVLIRPATRVLLIGLHEISIDFFGNAPVIGDVYEPSALIAASGSDTVTKPSTRPSIDKIGKSEASILSFNAVTI
jgi:hypothetical protein